MCNISHARLRSQFLKFLPKATADYRSRVGGTCFESWRHVLRLDAKSRGVELDVLAPELFPALAQLGAFTGSSSDHFGASVYWVVIEFWGDCGLGLQLSIDFLQRLHDIWHRAHTLQARLAVAQETEQAPDTAGRNQRDHHCHESG